MPLPIPGTEFKLRLLDTVETEDEQYDIFDIGLQHPDGGIDSLAFGGSCYSLKNAVATLNRVGFERREKEAAKKSAD